MRTYEIYSRTHDEQPTAVMESMVGVADIGHFLASAFGGVAGFLARHGTQPAGPPFARYHRIDGARFQVEAGFPVAQPIAAEGDVRPLLLPGGTVAVTMHIGPYAAIGPAYEAIERWISDHDGQPVGDAWEVYFDDPSREPDPTAWRTEVVQPYHATATVAG